jgi:hypothetical protein
MAAWLHGCMAAWLLLMDVSTFLGCLYRTPTQHLDRGWAQGAALLLRNSVAWTPYGLYTHCMYGLCTYMYSGVYPLA